MPRPLPDEVVFPSRTQTAGTSDKSPPISSSRSQLKALMRKNWLLKKRAHKTTCAETCAPPFFLAILVLGYSLSNVITTPAKSYASTSLNITALQVGFSRVFAGNPVSDLSGIGILSNTSNAAPTAALPQSLRSAWNSLDALLTGALPVLPVEIFLSIGLAVRDALGDENLGFIREVDSYLRLFGNILTPGDLHFAPDTPSVRQLVNASLRRHPILGAINMIVHPTEAEALHAIREAPPSQRTWALLSFNDLSPLHVNYSIRLNYSTVPNTHLITNFITQGLDTTYQRYHTSGFLTLQALVDEFAFDLAASSGVAYAATPPSSYSLLTPMPTARFSQNLFYAAVAYLLALVLTMCQLFPVALLVKQVVVEKEMRLKQTMRIMGLRDGVLYFSWWLTALLQFALITILCTIVTKLFVVKTAWWIIFIYIGTFCLGAISFAFFLSVFFSNAVLAAVVGPIAFFGALLPRYLFFGTNRFEKPFAKMAASLLLPTAFAFGADILADYELSEVGVSPANWSDSSYSFLTSMGMMLVDTMLYSILGLYLERVLPSRYGSHEHALFFLLPSWWACHSPQPSPTRAQVPRSPAFEQPSATLVNGESVEIVHLVKKYGSGSMRKTAVDDLNMSFYSGQITCLLGHNGAGKTSTLSVLTGLYQPTSGDCFVFGHSITSARRTVYRMLGICPQHDVLWHSLTTYEHLQLYAILKGVPLNRVDAVAIATLAQVGIPEKRAVRSHALSGGMKRKLSVGCALIGGSRAVLLDEPSSGMDPSSRRSMWDLLRLSKPSRVLVLTTHYMDEADILADRIAVMSLGHLQCCGSSLFLKARFGLGYTLSMVVSKDGGLSVNGEDHRGACLGATNEEAADKVAATLRKFVPNIQLLSAAGDELSFRLPFSAASRFGALLSQLENKKQELGVGSYGMSVTSMEEVFLRLAQGENGLTPAAEFDDEVAAPDASLPAPITMPEHDSGPLPASCVGLNASLAQAPASFGAVPQSRPASASRVDVELSPALESGSVDASNESRDVPSTAPGRSPPPSPPHGSSTSTYTHEGFRGRVLDENGKQRSVTTGLRPSVPPAWRQLLVLLFKRMTCIKRDKKALVLQQLLPIGLVALVLLILTIEDPRVGPPLHMHSGLYRRKLWNEQNYQPPTEFVCNRERETAVYRHTNRTALDWLALDSRIATSRDMSNYLLRTYNEHERSVRMGAATSDDEFHLRLDLGESTLATLLSGILPTGTVSVPLALLGCARWQPGGAGFENWNPAAQLEATIQGLNTSDVDLPGVARLLVDGWLSLFRLANTTAAVQSPSQLASSLADARNGAFNDSTVNGTANTSAALLLIRNTLASFLDPVLLAFEAAFASLDITRSVNALPPSGLMGLRETLPISVPLKSILDNSAKLGSATLLPFQPGSGQRRSSQWLRPGEAATSTLQGETLSTQLCDLLGGVDLTSGLRRFGANGTVRDRTRPAAAVNPSVDTFMGRSSYAHLLTQMTLNGQPLPHVAVDITIDALARSFTSSVKSLVDSIDLSMLLEPLNTALEPLRVSGLLTSANGIIDSIFLEAQILVAVTTLRSLLTKQLGVTNEDAKESITAERIEALLPYLRSLNALVEDMTAWQKGEQVHLMLLEKQTFHLADILSLLAEVASSNATLQLAGVADDLRSASTTGAPLTFGPLTLRHPTIGFDEVLLSDGLYLTNVALTGTGELHTTPPRSFPMRIDIESLAMASTTLRISDISLMYDGVTSTFDGFSFNASVLPEIMAAHTIDILMPVALTLLHNSSSPHAVSAFLGEMTSAAWKEAHHMNTSKKEASSAEKATYALYNAPLPLTSRQSLEVKLVLALLSALFLLIPFCYIPASAAVFVVKERITKSKHLQLVSGANANLYWLATFIWDLFVYTCVICGCMLVFAAYAEPSFVGSATQAGAIFMVLFFYGLSVLPLVYCYSFLFDSPTTAQISIIIFNFVASFVMVVAHQIMSILPNTQAADRVIQWIWRLLPGYNFGQGVLLITTTYYENELLSMSKSPFEFDVIGLPVLLMGIEAILYSAILLRLESSQQLYSRCEPCLAKLCGASEPSLSLSRSTKAGLLACFTLSIFLFAGGSTASMAGAALVLIAGLAVALLWERRRRRVGDTAEARARAALIEAEGPAFEEEQDVASERARVKRQCNSVRSRGHRPHEVGNDAVVISSLRKVYPARGKAPPKVAVVDLSLGIHSSECFGFLGVNGAGKTSTLSILTGDYLPSSGNAWIDGYHVVHDRQRVRERMGYCPQTDPLLELMTARESLFMFARLKNLPERRIPSIVRELLEKTTLTPYADRVSGSYSGGNKRKLSLAIALVGSPAVVFLDEPSSGMDPVSRRHMWEIIMRERMLRSIVLTTHSMEECEALCTRIGIMTAGRLQCLGGQQRLKSKFGGGYTLELRVAEERTEQDVQAKIAELFPRARLEARHAGKLKYELPMKGLSLASVFETMEAQKKSLGVLDYSASQPSLESIFLAIAEKDINRAPHTSKAALTPVRIQANSQSDYATELVEP